MQNKNGLENECEAINYHFISINKNVKDIINNNKINNEDNYRLKNGRDYSKFDWTSLYVNNFY